MKPPELQMLGPKPVQSDIRRPWVSITHSNIDLRMMGLCAISLGILVTPALSAMAGPIGDAVLLSMCIIGFVVFVVSIPFRLAAIFLTGMTLVLIYTISALSSDHVQRGLKHALSAFSGIIVLLFFAKYGKILLQSRYWRLTVCALMVLSALVLLLAGLQKNIATGAVAYMLATTIIVLIYGNAVTYWLAALAFSVAAAGLGYLNEFRAMIGYAMVFLCAVIWLDLAPRILRFVGATTIVSICIIGLIWYFNNINSSAFAAYISNIINDISGRPASSGREWLWPAIFNAVGDNIWFGNGAGALPEDYFTTHYSSHNHYIQVYMQTGFIGLGSLVAFLMCVWWRLSEGEGVKAVFGAAIFLMFTLHNASEVIMLQNGLLAGTIAWAAIGMTLSDLSQRNHQGVKPVWSGSGGEQNV